MIPKVVSKLSDLYMFFVIIMYLLGNIVNIYHGGDEYHYKANVANRGHWTMLI